ncbi:hypothetical protein [Nonomuraea sp. B1E8]|uniref:hypothetical protein n=1 Tax=unclassified Nonomuraea TaxID=2593643 RepID=UPI00325EE039
MRRSRALILDAYLVAYRLRKGRISARERERARLLFDEVLAHETPGAAGQEGTRGAVSGRISRS